MAATKEDRDRWIETAEKWDATHIISVCDTFSMEDFPVYVTADDNLETIRKVYDRPDNMSRINEIITL